MLGIRESEPMEQGDVSVWICCASFRVENLFLKFNFFEAIFAPLLNFESIQ